MLQPTSSTSVALSAAAPAAQKKLVSWQARLARLPTEHARLTKQQQICSAAAAARHRRRQGCMHHLQASTSMQVMQRPLPHRPCYCLTTSSSSTDSSSSTTKNSTTNSTTNSSGGSGTRMRGTPTRCTPRLSRQVQRRLLLQRQRRHRVRPVPQAQCKHTCMSRLKWLGSSSADQA